MRSIMKCVWASALILFLLVPFNLPFHLDKDYAVLADSGDYSQGTTINPTHWMEETADQIMYTPLYRVALPGTHDSATYALVSTYLRPANDVFAPDADGVLVKAGTFADTTEKWAKAQENDIYQQLSDGIRVLDLRVCVEKNGNFRACHGMYGPNISDILKDVKRFAIQYPKEILFVKVGGFYQNTPKPDMTEAKHAELIALIKSELSPVLVDHKRYKPDTTLSAIWSDNQVSKTNKSVFVIYDKANNDFWGPDQKNSQTTWVKTWNKDIKKQSLDDAVRNKHEPNKFFDLAVSATPDANSIGLAGIINYPGSLKALADIVNPVVLGWVKNEWHGAGLNIIAVDFYNRTCLLNLIWFLNDKHGKGSFAGCNIGTNTVWGDLRGSMPCPAGYREDGLYCAKPGPYGRGTGYAWQPADGISDSGMFHRCEADNGAGNCEKQVAIVYPKCRSGFHAVECCVCSPDCPSGMTDRGVSCEK